MKLLPLAVAGIALLGAASLAQAQKVAPADKSFAVKATGAGMAEVAEARIALGKTQNGDVKSFAQRMDQDHTKANDELMKIAQDERLKLPAAPTKKDQAQANKLSKMSGAAFDQAYIKDQLAAHQEAVALFTKESQSGKDAQLKAFAAKTLPILQEHLQMVQGMAGKK
jgi:putative membrane protein